MGDEARRELLVVADDGTQDIEAAFAPEIVDDGGLTLVDGEPAITLQALQRLAQRGAGNAKLRG